jgi:uncharacterized protein (DUF433 family)
MTSSSRPATVGHVGNEEPGIVSNPGIAFGVPTVRGTRIWVDLVLGLVEDGAGDEALMAEYPELTQARIEACRAHGRRLAQAPHDEV